MASKDLKGEGLGLPVGSIPVFCCRGKNSLQNTIFHYKTQHFTTKHNISNRHLIRKPIERNLRALLSLSTRLTEDYKVNCKS
jgi:hypothetical protein